MPLIDLDKTSYKFKDVLKIISVTSIVVGGVWRFESRMSDIDDNVDALEIKIMYKYELEILKINNRIDLIEAKKYVQRQRFKSDTLSYNQVRVVCNDRNANRDNHKKEKYPQFCIILPRSVEYETRPKLPNIKKLIS